MYGFEEEKVDDDDGLEEEEEGWFERLEPVEEEEDVAVAVTVSVPGMESV